VSTELTAAVDALWDRIEAWLAASAPHVLAGLNGGATDEEFAVAEVAIGVTLPEDVRASWRRRNGQKNDDGDGMLTGGYFHSLADMVDDWQAWQGALTERSTDPGWENVTPAGDVDPGIRPLWWNPAWVPVSRSDSGISWCVDTDPAQGSRAGQIILVHPHDPWRSVEAENFTALLSRFADDLEAGEYVVSDEYTGIIPWQDVSEYADGDGPPGRTSAAEPEEEEE